MIIKKIVKLALQESWLFYYKSRSGYHNIPKRIFTYSRITSFHGDDAIKPVYDLYMNNPDSRKEELKRAFDEKSVDEEYININIMLFMEDKNASPSEKVLKRVEQDLTVMDGIPYALYTVLINDNRVHKESFEGYKDNKYIENRADTKSLIGQFEGGFHEKPI